MPRPGLSPATVARYDQVLCLVASQWPKETWIGDTSSGSLNTVAARCRDAIKAIVDGLVPHPTADFLRRIRNDLVVRIDGENVVIGPRPSKVPASLSASASEAHYPLAITNPDPETICAVLVLARKGHLTSPVLLRGCNPQQVTPFLNPNDDIAVFPIPPNSTSVM